jgi:hypothetical protein
VLDAMPVRPAVKDAGAVDSPCTASPSEVARMAVSLVVDLLVNLAMAGILSASTERAVALRGRRHRRGAGGEAVELDAEPERGPAVQIGFDADPDAGRAVGRGVGLTLLQRGEHDQVADLAVAGELGGLELGPKVDPVA